MPLSRVAARSLRQRRRLDAAERAEAGAQLAAEVRAQLAAEDDELRRMRRGGDPSRGVGCHAAAAVVAIVELDARRLCRCVEGHVERRRVVPAVATADVTAAVGPGRRLCRNGCRPRVAVGGCFGGVRAAMLRGRLGSLPLLPQRAWRLRERINVRRAHEDAVPRQAAKVADRLDGAVVLAKRLVELDTHPRAVLEARLAAVADDARRRRRSPLDPNRDALANAHLSCRARMRMAPRRVGRAARGARCLGVAGAHVRRRRREKAGEVEVGAPCQRAAEARGADLHRAIGHHDDLHSTRRRILLPLLALHVQLHSGTALPLRRAGAVALQALHERLHLLLQSSDSRGCLVGGARLVRRRRLRRWCIGRMRGALGSLQPCLCRHLLLRLLRRRWLLQRCAVASQRERISKCGEAPKRIGSPRQQRAEQEAMQRLPLVLRRVALRRMASYLCSRCVALARRLARRLGGALLRNPLPPHPNVVRG